jgi:hypothetical protein
MVVTNASPMFGRISKAAAGSMEAAVLQQQILVASWTSNRQKSLNSADLQSFLALRKRITTCYRRAIVLSG